MSIELENVKELFLQAVEISPEQRDSFLNEKCQGDPELRQNVEKLLRGHDSNFSFVDRVVNDETRYHERPTDFEGQRIGPYKLLNLIGEGGMGVVYLAEQDEPVQRQVALKLIKPGMDTSQVVARFEAEEQALALMDHPGIAKVFDAGSTESGRPYFVMELIQGIPIHKFCDQHRLDTKQRLKLFVQVCQAVQHAHQKGIIHRDLKPSNILVGMVDNQPTPKIIDFGVAKATGPERMDKTTLTRIDQVIGTLEYMSPEQTCGEPLDIDTRADIYALGAILYELLTGSPPFEIERMKKQTLDETMRMIREEEPTRPSTKLHSSVDLEKIARNRHTQPQRLSALVHGDLDWIVMKALEKDRARRYPSAGAFAADIERFLKNETVEACPPSRAYRMKKFVRRNRVGLAFTALVGIGLVLAVAGLATSNYLLNERDKNTQRALKQASDNLTLAEINEEKANDNLRKFKQADERTKLINDFVITNIVNSANPNKGSRDITVRKTLLGISEKIVEEFGDKPVLRAHVSSIFGDYLFGIGEYKAARRHLEDALSIFRTEYKTDNSYTIETLFDLANVYIQTKEYPLAISTAKEGATRMAASDKTLHNKALRSMGVIATAFVQERKLAEAGELALELLDLSKTNDMPKHEIVAANVLGIANFWGQNYDQAEMYWSQALALCEELGDSNNIILVKSNLAMVLWETNRHEESIALSEELKKEISKLKGADHPHALHIIAQLAQKKFHSRDIAGSISDFRLLVERARSRHGDDSEKTALRMSELGVALRSAGEFEEAVELQQSALAIEEREFGGEHFRVLDTLGRLALTCEELGDYDKANDYFQRAITTRLKIAKNEKADWKNLVSLGGLYCNFGTYLRDKKGDHAAALDANNKAIATLENVNLTNPTADGKNFLSKSYMSRAKALADLKRWDESVVDADKAISNANSPGQKDDMLLEKARLLGMAGDTDSAAEIVNNVLEQIHSKTNKDELYMMAARVMAICGIEVMDNGQDATNNESQQSVNNYQRRCIQLLHDADQAGYFRNNKRFRELDNEKDFASLRHLADFQSFSRQMMENAEVETRPEALLPR